MSSSTPGITIQFRATRTLAVLCISADVATPSLIVEQCIKCIESAGLLMDEKMEAEVRAAVAHVHQNQGAAYEHVLASGRAPVHGKDGRFEWLPDFDPEKLMLGESADDESVSERVDHYAVTKFRMAREGDHIATVHPPTIGKEGVTFDGTTLPARTGKPYKLRHDDSVELQDDGSVIARTSGVISTSSGKLRVLDVLDIPGNVDFHTGNIEFIGAVAVRKDVCDCFTVSCTDDLSVSGLIQASHIKAGGDVTFSRGMAGREKGEIDIRGSLHARYLEGVKGSVRQNLRVEREIVNCSLNVGRNLELETGTLINSCVRVGAIANIGTLGSSAYVRTTVSVGDLAVLDADLYQIRRLIPQTSRQLEALREQRKAVLENAARPMSDQDEQLLEIDTRIELIVPRLNALRARERQILQVLERNSPCELHVQGEVFANSIVVLRDVASRITCDLLGPLRIQFDSRGEPIVVDVQSGENMPLSSVSQTVNRQRAYEGYLEAESAAA